MVFVTGEPGIGKTTVTKSFCASLALGSEARIGRAQCIEQYGWEEPYMPILEALTRLCNEAGGDHLVEVLNRVAPSWLAQMPALLSEPERERLAGIAQGVTQPRMLREMAEALEALSHETPLVLVFEDLHWNDASTLELIAVIGRCAEPARLLVIGTYRPVEMLTNDSIARGQGRATTAATLRGGKTQATQRTRCRGLSIETFRRKPTTNGHCANHPQAHRGQSSLHGECCRLLD
jgi:predicted ATPase